MTEIEIMQKYDEAVSSFAAGLAAGLLDADQEKAFKEQYELFKAGRDALRRAAEYDKAQSEGRVVVLPCKSGDKIYNTASLFSTLKEPEERIVEGFSSWYGEITILCKGGYRTFDSKIGKTVFLTRAEAEAALGGGGDG